MHFFFPPFRKTFPRSFGLTQKNQKVKATLEKAANSLHSAKIPDNSRFALRQPGFLHAPLAICFTPSSLGRSLFLLLFVLPFYFSSFNSQFSILNSQFLIFHSQLTKSRRVFIISRRLFIKRRRLFSLSCLPSRNK